MRARRTSPAVPDVYGGLCHRQKGSFPEYLTPEIYHHSHTGQCRYKNVVPMSQRTVWQWLRVSGRAEMWHWQSRSRFEPHNGSMSTTTPNPSSPRHAPIGAITSRLVGRSTLTLPPSDQSYEPLVKSLFRSRLRYMLLLSASSTWSVISCWTWWQSGGVLRAGLWAAIVLLFGPLTLFITAVNWAMVALPVIVLHKVFLTGKWLNHRSSNFYNWLKCRTSFFCILSDYHRQKFSVAIQHQNCIRNASSVRNLCFNYSRLYGLHVWDVCSWGSQTFGVRQVKVSATITPLKPSCKSHTGNTLIILMAASFS